jgi:hypothetical protein
MHSYLFPNNTLFTIFSSELTRSSRLIFQEAHVLLKLFRFSMEYKEDSEYATSGSSSLAPQKLPH